MRGHLIATLLWLALAVSAVLSWDQTTYMPPGGAPARAQQMATLGRLSHEKFIDPAVGKLLDELQPYAESLPYESDDASLIRITQRDYDQATKIPADVMAEFSAHSAAAKHVLKTTLRPFNPISRKL